MMLDRFPALRTGLPAALALAVVVVLSLHPVCHVLFRCGCEPIWWGGIEHCNVFTKGVPHCPWCTRLALLWAALAAGPGFLAVFWAGRRGSLARALCAGLLGYLVGALLSGLLAAGLSGYPIFLGFRL